MEIRLVAVGVKSPGSVVAEHLSTRGWTQADLARVLGSAQKKVNEIVTGGRSITMRTAQELAAAFGTSPAYWLDLQAAFDLAQASEPDEAIAIRARVFDKAPVAEMIRRGWIAPSDDPHALESSVARFFRLESIRDEPQLWAHAARKSSSYSAVTPGQWAWLFRARQLAEAIQAEPYSDSKIDGLLRQLRLLLQDPPELRRLPRLLSQAGVRLVIVEPLAGSKIDGACFWLDERSPVVALSIRFDRIDGFWHTLMHELGHVKNRDGLEGAVLPLDVDLVGEQLSNADRPDSEKAADDFAKAFLVDPEELDDFVVRVSPLYSRQRIVGFANRLKIHPGIVVGQLHHLQEIPYAQNRGMLVKVRAILSAVAITDGWGSMPTVGASA